ncbi:MAG: chemotaxis protein CheW [Proteobacteria bacterium SG_bin5]|nr:chemotaxis protein CheW [Sphingomonas sp.]OQW39310.1 MAG: chemotaxis protein CheW [Proteobacteria bacterium SG_bin5]
MTSKLFLIARIAGRAVAIDSDQVESVVDVPEITPVPGTGAVVHGLAALRSRVVTVIDTCIALDLLPSPRAPKRAVITHVDGHHYALPVDQLEDVALFDPLPLAEGVAIEGGWARAAAGLVVREGDPMLVIDLRALIPGVAAAA